MCTVPLLANMKPVEMVLRYFYHAPDVNEKHSLIEKTFAEDHRNGYDKNLQLLHILG